MLTLVLNVCILLGAPWQVPAQQAAAQQAPAAQAKTAPTAEQVAQACAALEAAYRSGDVPELKKALEAASLVPHPDVVRKVVRGLEDERLDVRLAAVSALRWLEHPDALVALHKAFKDRKRLKPVEYAAALLRAIGQHADPSSIALLAQDPFEPPDPDCIRSRIYALGRVRTHEALDALLGILMISIPGARPGELRVQPWMDEMRLSLMVLTGIDQGASADLWEHWWRENKRTFEVPAKIPLMPKELREKWDRYWGLERNYAREGLREDRGNDPEPPRKKE